MSSSISCVMCLMPFDTHKALNEHTPQCQVLIIQYPNGPISISRNTQGLYVCQCAHPSCPTPFKNKRHLQKHVNMVAKPWVHSKVRNPAPKMSCLLINHRIWQSHHCPQALLYLHQCHDWSTLNM